MCFVSSSFARCTIGEERGCFNSRGMACSNCPECIAAHSAAVLCPECVNTHYARSVYLGFAFCLCLASVRVVFVEALNGLDSLYPSTMSFSLGGRGGGAGSDGPLVDNAEMIHISSLALLKMLKHGTPRRWPRSFLVSVCLAPLSHCVARFASARAPRMHVPSAVCVQSL